MKLPKHLAVHEGRTGGTYVVVTRDHAWGRGATLVLACTQARRAGARSFAVGRVAVVWQPDSAWTAIRDEHLAKGGAVAASARDRAQHDDYRPTVNEVTGAVVGWGGGFERLVDPNAPRAGGAARG